MKVIGYDSMSHDALFGNHKFDFQDQPPWYPLLPLIYAEFVNLISSFFRILHPTFSALFKENKLSLDSFLLNHSTAYHLALAAGLVEYLIEYVNLDHDKFYPVSISLITFYIKYIDHELI